MIRVVSRGSISSLLAAALLLCGCRGAGSAGAAQHAGTAEVQRRADFGVVTGLEVATGWIGLGPSASASLTLAADAGRFHGEWVQNRTEYRAKPNLKTTRSPIQVDGSGVAAVVDAVTRPCAAEPTLALFGLTPEVLRQHSPTAQQSIRSDFNYSSASAAQRAEFDRAFTDPAQAGPALKQLFENEHTDDFPHAKLLLRLKNGDVVQAESSSQFLQMLPWTIQRPGAAPCRSYDPALSTALGALLPEQMTNAQRLRPTYLYSQLADQVIFRIREHRQPR